ncbi:MAG: helix-turn-helix domain-containing protein [Bacillota bacterium]
MIFSDGFRRYREEIVQLSQVEVAKRLNISKQSMNNYESGKNQIPNDILRKLAHLYQISPMDLYSIISGTAYPDDNSENTMVLREKFEDTETERAIELLQKFPQLKDLIISTSYYDPKKQEKVINRLVSVMKAMQE